VLGSIDRPTDRPTHRRLSLNDWSPTGGGGGDDDDDDDDDDGNLRG
jgi:hypothetical protein